MTGVANIGSDPILSSLWPQAIHSKGRISSEVADSFSIKGDEEEYAGVYSVRDILMGTESNEEILPGVFDESERQMIAELEARDREVRAHEQAHAALLGRYAVGGPSYAYQVGPDGRAYAVGGSIMVDTGTEATPEATAMKAQILGRAAMGGGISSDADRAVALSAVRMGIQATA